MIVSMACISTGCGDISEPVKPCLRTLCLFTFSQIQMIRWLIDMLKYSYSFGAKLCVSYSVSIQQKQFLGNKSLRSGMKVMPILRVFMGGGKIPDSGHLSQQ